MKKILLSLLICISLFGLTSCNQATYQIPELIGLDISEAKLLIAGEVKTSVEYEVTNQYLPNRVIGFGDELEVNDMIKTNKTLKLIVAKAPEDSFSYSDMIEYVLDLGFVTGPNSQNFDLLRAHGAGSTDLGIPVKVDDHFVFLYGDTFSGTENMSGIWKSNFMAITSDTTFHDGLTYDALITGTNSVIQPFAEGLHHKSETDEASTNPNREVTKIPTGGIQIGNDVYLFYMSIRYWGTHGDWAVSYAQVVKTDTSMSSFTEVSGLRWTEDEAYNFAQMYPFENPEEPDYIYFISIPGGRYGGTALSRVLKTQFEDFEQYEYYIGNDTWVMGSDGLATFKSNPYMIIDGPCSEMSMMYNNYLDKWMVVYLSGSEIIFRTADTLTSDWSSPETIVTGSDFSGLYGGFIHPEFTDYDGQKFYFQLSRWLPIYQTQLIEVVLK